MPFYAVPEWNGIRLQTIYIDDADKPTAPNNAEN